MKKQTKTNLEVFLVEEVVKLAAEEVELLVECAAVRSTRLLVCDDDDAHHQRFCENDLV